VFHENRQTDVQKNRRVKDNSRFYISFAKEPKIYLYNFRLFFCIVTYFHSFLPLYSAALRNRQSDNCILSLRSSGMWRYSLSTYFPTFRRTAMPFSWGSGSPRRVMYLSDVFSVKQTNKTAWSRLRRHYNLSKRLKHLFNDTTSNLQDFNLQQYRCYNLKSCKKKTIWFPPSYEKKEGKNLALFIWGVRVNSLRWTEAKEIISMDRKGECTQTSPFLCLLLYSSIVPFGPCQSKQKPLSIGKEIILLSLTNVRVNRMAR
jgi:hypothetical protein